MKKQNEENAVGPPAQNSTYEGNSGQAQTNPSSQIQGIIRSTIEAQASPFTSDWQAVVTLQERMGFIFNL